MFVICNKSINQSYLFGFGRYNINH